MLGGGCMKQKHLHSTIGPAHAPNQHTQYVTLLFSYIELIVSGLFMLSREPGCARLYHTNITKSKVTQPYTVPYWRHCRLACWNNGRLASKYS